MKTFVVALCLTLTMFAGNSACQDHDMTIPMEQIVKSIGSHFAMLPIESRLSLPIVAREKDQLLIRRIAYGTRMVAGKVRRLYRRISSVNLITRQANSCPYTAISHPISQSTQTKAQVDQSTTRQFR